MGVSNICSGFLGGLTIIPGIIKSTTCIVAGGRTAWANFYNALFLISFLLIFNDLISMIPIAALSAVLVHIGFKLAGPHKWQQVYEVGWDQLAVFSTTVVVTLFSDLLLGIAAGIAMKILILLGYEFRCDCRRRHSIISTLKDISRCFVLLFRNPIKEVRRTEGSSEVIFTGPVTCFNNLYVRNTLDPLLKESEQVRLNLTPRVAIVDHTSTLYLNLLERDSEHVGLAKVTLEGLNELSCCTADTSSLHYRVKHV